MSCCQLDVLPVELIHHLLNYFSAHEIFYTFTNVSLYIDNVLLNYSNYCVNFKSVTRKEFDFVCQRIKPDQIVSLTLSDDEDTAGQVELFLSRFQINQFTRLRSLTLIEVGPDYWEPIVAKLIDLKNLRAFIYDSSTNNDSSTYKIPFVDVVELDKRLSDTYSPILSQLTRLKFSHADYLPSVQLPYLRHLIVGKCKANIMPYICSAAPQLKSIETELQCNQTNIDFSFSFNQLDRLVLQITGSATSMDKMEELMGKLPRLKYLKLRGHGGADLLDGQRWQMITSGLNTFNFTLNVSDVANVDVGNLDSFRSPFWLTEKCWYVAYSFYRHLYSVPYFTDKLADVNFKLPSVWTAPDVSIFYESIKKLNLSESGYDISHRFSQVEILTMSNFIHLPFIEQIIDLNRIQHLILSSMQRYFELVVLISEMPNLGRISIINNIKLFLEEIAGGSFEQIRNLEIGHGFLGDSNLDGRDYSIEQLSSIFPGVKHLRVSDLCSTTRILSFIDTFKHLKVASFRSIPYFSASDNTGLLIEMASALKRHRSVRKLDYSYRLSKSHVYVWL